MMRAVRAVVCALAIGSNAHAQGVPRVTAGWGVDTAAAAWSESAWHDAAREIYRAWSEYLRADPHLQQPTPHWSAAEQTRWPLYDLTSSIAYQGFGATILDIRPTDDERDGFIIRTLFASAADGVVRPVALTRVHAVRQDGRWVFANTLPRLTRSWQRATIGPVTYIIQPGVHFDPGLAVRALAAADSLADALGLARIDSLDYYVANNPEQLHRVMGIDWTFGGQGHGYALPWNRMVLSGDSEFGVANVHELVHYVLAPLLQRRRTHRIIGEGIATWVGGSIGRTFDELRREYAVFLAGHPDVTLDAVLAAEGADIGFYPAGAMLVDMVHERSGLEGVKQLLESGRSDAELKDALVTLLDAPWTETAASWRERFTRVLETGR